MTEIVLSRAVQETVDAHTEQARALAAAADRLQIRNDTEARLATEFLARAAKVRKANEAARVAEVKPLNDQVKVINAAFKGEPERLLGQADHLVRDRLTTYQVEQERQRRAEQERLEAERRERERRAEEERRRLAAEAEQARREAEDAERRRQAELAAAQDVLAQRVAVMDADELHAAAVSDDVELRDAARAEIQVRSDRLDAQARIDAAQAAAAHVAQLQVQTAPVVPIAPAGPTRSASGSSSMRKRWVGEVVDEQAVPREYLAVDQRLINQAVRDGVRDIPGVRIWEKPDIAVRSA
jgi:colicin import membrane protein